MARLACLIVPGLPHHITQRGSRRALIFFENAEYAPYCDLLAGRCRKASVACWAYCLMPKHVHLIRTLRRALPREFCRAGPRASAYAICALRSVATAARDHAYAPAIQPLIDIGVICKHDVTSAGGPGAWVVDS
jgi:putative transposase